MSHSDVRLDFNFAMDLSLPEEGLSVKEIEGLEAIAREIHRGLVAMKEVGQIPFYQLPYQEESALRLLQKANEYRESFENLVVLGIGGSALGAKAVISSLQGPTFNLLPPEKRGRAMRVFICDNIDPDALSALLDLLDFKKTLFNVISKSGDSIETMSQFTWMRQLLIDRVGADWRRHIVVTTDPVKGNLRAMVAEEGFVSFEIPPGVGGRFSVLSPVGLFPAAMAGVDIQELLSGARRADVRAAQEDLWLNPAYMLAAVQYLMFKKKKNVLVLMPYSEMMFPIAEWYCQLWAESIGKRFSLKGEEVNTGSTPVAACGVKDQHSQLQLYMEGPRDKFILFFLLEHFQKNIPIPKETFEQGNLSYLGSHTMEAILKAEAQATEAALRDAGRPSSRVLIPRRTPYDLGQLLFLLEVATAFAGGLFEVNPFDQPGVELGKKMTGGLLGRPGHEAFKDLVPPKKRNEQFVI